MLPEIENYNVLQCNDFMESEGFDLITTKVNTRDSGSEFV